MSMPLSVLRPRTLSEAEAMLASIGTSNTIAAGATSLQLDWRRGNERAAALVDINGIPALRGIDIGAAGLRIGATTRLAALEHDPRVVAVYPLLVQTICSIAAPGIRRLATIGGNVASGSGCLLPTLLALDATIQFSFDHKHQSEGLAAWLRRPQSQRGLVLAIGVPPMPEDARAIQRKIGLRTAFTPSVIGAAAVVTLDSVGRIRAARLAVGGGIVTPQRLGTTEARLLGSALDDLDSQALRAMIVGEIKAESDAFRSAAYRKHVAANIIVAGLQGRHAWPSAAPPCDDVPTLPADIGISRDTMGARWRVRPDLAEKVDGRLRYLTDHRTPEMLVGRILRAGRPHARILSLDTAAAEALPGVVAVVTAKDVAGLNGYGIVVADQPALCADKVRYGGDAVAAVAAIDEDTAGRALALIKVDYEPLPIVDDAEAALAPDAPRVHAAGNLQREMHFTRGDVATAIPLCAAIVEDVYVTPRQMHGFMETEGGYAIPEPDGSLTVCVGGQHGARDRLQLSRILALPEDKIRVVTSPTGGAFGGKDELTVQPALALLALKAKRPVRLQLDRAESVLAGWKRNPMRIRMRTGCDAAGRLTFQEVELLADAGAYASLGPAVVETALEHACGPYVVPHVATHARLAYTNNGVCGAFRGFGANQMTFAIECQIARLAEKVGLDPIAMRRQNLREPGSPGYLGQVVAPSERLHAMLDAAAASPLWRQRGAADGEACIGVGMALNLQGNGLGSVIPDPGGGRLSLLCDGRIEAAFGLDELGQGLGAAIQSSVAAVLGCDRDDILPLTGDTGRTPDSGSTTASRGTYVVWRTAQVAGPPFGRLLREAAASILRRGPEALVIAPGGFRAIGSNSGALLLSFSALAAALAPDELPATDAQFEFPKADFHDANARFIFAFGATLARVAVDRVSGQVRVLDLDQHIAAGPILDPAAYLGQIEGGGVQGVGFTLSEDAIMDKGVFLTHNLDGYMMPGLADAPTRMRVFALEELDPGDPYGPRGIGEIGIGAVTPAIAAAVADAIGFWPAVTPFAPEQLLNALASHVPSLAKAEENGP